MCSIEEAWAGQDFENKPVVSQADIHNAYMSLPDNVFQRGNDLNLNEPNNCILHNSSESGNINIPNKYPTFPQTNIENSNYNWLIDPVRNNIIRQHGYVF